ncbi:MAG: histidine kinase dimerization/phospho-acceptor domain-containing protein, partial [Vulcanimicrobiaceae bacterium]
MSRSLRARLALAYGAALVVGLVAFALAALVVLDRLQDAALAQQLQTDARAVATIVNEHDGRLRLDVDDRRQFALIVGTRGHGAIVAGDGTVLASTPGSIPPALAVLARQPQVGERGGQIHDGGETLRYVALGVPPGRRIGTVVLWRSPGPIYVFDRRAALDFALAIVPIVALAVLAGAFLTGRALEPLRALAGLASEIEAHDLSRRLGGEPSGDELGVLCATFDRMLDRLEGAFERERRFAADASHELRAPLSVITAEAELALRRPRSSAEYQAALRAIAAEAAELEALTSDLLAAARGTALARRERVDLGALAEGVAG